jgi:hypothetical protein
MIVNDNSSVVNKHETSLTDDARVHHLRSSHVYSTDPQDSRLFYIHNIKDYDITIHFGLYCLQANYSLSKD